TPAATSGSAEKDSSAAKDSSPGKGNSDTKDGSPPKDARDSGTAKTSPTGAIFTVLPLESGNYVKCPVDDSATSDTLLCSQSLLTYQEAKHLFGQAVAKSYRAIEVKVRNLSSQFPYLLHDVRLGIDKDLVTSRDRKLVRGYAEKTELYSARA